MRDAFPLGRLMRGALAAAALTLAMGAALSNAQAQGCAFRSAPTILLEDGAPHAAGSRLLQVWEEPNQPSFWRAGEPADGYYEDYRRKIAERGVETDPLRLLRGSPDFNNDLVARNARRWIKPANCLEKLLLGQQHARMDMLETTTEFVSVILRRPHDDRLRVYSYTVNRNGIDTVRMEAATFPLFRKD